MSRSKVIITVTLLLFSVPTLSRGFVYPQNSDRNNRGQSQDRLDNRSAPQDHRNSDRNARPASNFNKGLRDGGHGGQYYDPRHAQDGYDDRFRQSGGYDQQRQGGIGPGKGALIGGAGGAVLGAIFGGGLKGTIVGGAAGAGIGAVVGEAKQDNRSRNDDHRR